MQLADRFHVLPWHLEDEPWDRAMYYMQVLSVAGEYYTDTAGMEPDEDYIEDED